MIGIGARSQERINAFGRALAGIIEGAGASAGPVPAILDRYGNPMRPTAEYGYRKLAAQRTGSMKNWIPKRILSRDLEARQRQEIVSRSIDLINNDPHAAGLIDNITVTTIGSGLVPMPVLSADMLGISKEEARKIQRDQLAAYMLWYPHADAAGRLNFGQIQFLCELSMLKYGEYLVLLPMINEPLRPFSLACKVVNPLRLKTPTDRVSDGTIADGIEIGPWGRPVAVWIKNASSTGRSLPDTSDNFTRVEFVNGHRIQVIHGFVCKDPEQVRGEPILTPAIKSFRDFSDLIDAELVSNVVTAAVAYWVKTNDPDPWEEIENEASDFDREYNPEAGREKKIFYKATNPGQIMYGNKGEEMELLAANRPGVTFEPFTRIIKKALSMACNFPYPVAFKDVEGVNFAGFRSAMLDAWRVVMTKRTWMSDGLCQPVYSMLQEEAYLRRHFRVKKFYSNMYFATRADWRGSPKGDIEPVKAAQSDIMLRRNNMKTLAKILAERGEGNIHDHFNALEEEYELERSKNLAPQPAANGATPTVAPETPEKPEKEEPDNAA